MNPVRGRALHVGCSRIGAPGRAPRTTGELPMSIRGLGRVPAAAWSARVVRALAGALAVVGMVAGAGLALGQEEAPAMSPEMQARLQELLKQAQQPEDEQAKQPE